MAVKMDGMFAGEVELLLGEFVGCVLGGDGVGLGMKMSLRVWCLFLVVMMGGMLVVKGEERPMFLPFDVTLGGVKAGNELFAEISKPVAADAALVLEEVVPMLIVNAFPCEADGTVKENQAAAVLFAQQTKVVKLDATMDKKKLPPGMYLANVVASGKTSRIVFEVAEADKKVDFSKILSFLKKKAGGE